MDPEITTTVDELLAAVSLLDHGRVDEICSRLIAQVRRGKDPFPADEAKRVLDDLRRKRFFQQMQRVADVLIQYGSHTPVVLRQYAQALIDQGALTAAAAVLREMLTDPVERTEAQGLLGRVYKQQYVDAVACAQGVSGHGTTRNAEALRQAIRHYYQPFQEAPADNYWHGINAVACAARARRDGVLDDVVADPARIAAEVLDRIRDRGDTADAWELATALEACVALGDEDAAIGRAVKYSQAPSADAFEIASTIRQLQQVWCLEDTTGPGKMILPLLRGALLQRETGGVLVSPTEIREAVRQVTEAGDAGMARLEKVLGSDAFTSYETYQTGARRARMVARIGREVRGRADGTAFLMCGADLSERFRDEEWLLLTNAHVLSSEAEHQPALFPDEAIVTFQALPPTAEHQQHSYRVESVLGLSGPDELDFAVIKLDRPVADIVAADRCEVARRLPVNNQKGRVYIIGHPAGGSLSYSIQDNLLLDYQDPRLHYRAPTEGGSSGSPVFNANWQLIALHHAGSREMPRLNERPGTYEANEGIWIQAIRRALT